METVQARAEGVPVSGRRLESEEVGVELYGIGDRTTTLSHVKTTYYPFATVTKLLRPLRLVWFP